MSSKEETIQSIETFASILETKGVVKNTQPLRDLKTQLKRCREDRGLKYNLSGLEFLDISNNQFIRQGEWENQLSLRLDILVRLYPNKTFMFGNVSEAVVNIEYSAMNEESVEECKGSWHLDFHIDEPRCSSPEFVHPMYHFHHGGKRLKEIGTYGNVILLDAPRILHHPLDVFLAIDFVVSNFSESMWRKLKADTSYSEIIENSQNQWWSTYYRKLAEYWAHKGQGGVDSQEICKEARLINPHLA